MRITIISKRIIIEKLPILLINSTGRSTIKKNIHIEYFILKEEKKTPFIRRNLFIVLNESYSLYRFRI